MTKKKKEKKNPLWFEDQANDFGNVQDVFRNMGKYRWGPWFKMPKIRMKFPRTKFIPLRVGETENEMFLRAELPGFKKNEIKLKVTPRSVYIAAEKKKKSVEKDETFFKMESAFSSASRVVPLPTEVRTEGAKARFEDGVLEVVLKKREPTKKKVSEVKID
jgi:HSP20 family protein